MSQRQSDIISSSKHNLCHHVQIWQICPFVTKHDGFHFQMNHYEFLFPYFTFLSPILFVLFLSMKGLCSFAQERGNTTNILLQLHQGRRQRLVKVY